MKLLEFRKFKIQDDIYKLEILEDDDGMELYKVFKNGNWLVDCGKYSNALRCLIASYEIPAKEGRAYSMERTEYHVIPRIDCWALKYKNPSECEYNMRVFDDEWHCLNWILCGYHYRD